MIKNTSFRRTMGMAVAGALASTAWAQQSITSFGGVSYSQNFNNTLSPFSDNNGFGNALSSSGVNQSTLPTGWAMSENGSSLGGLYNVSSGGGPGSSDPDAGANLYSYGALNNAERALGSLRGGGNAANNIFGVLFQNNTEGNSGGKATAPSGTLTGLISATMRGIRRIFWLELGPISTILTSGQPQVRTPPVATGP
jgi:hypothetical protein